MARLRLLLLAAVAAVVALLLVQVPANALDVTGTPRRSSATPPSSAVSARPTAAAACPRRTWTARTSWRSTCTTRRATTAPSRGRCPRRRPTSSACWTTAELRPVRAGHHRRLLHRHQRRRAERTVLPQRFLGPRQVRRRDAEHGRRGQLRRLERLVPRRPVPPRPAPGLAEPVRPERHAGRGHVADHWNNRHISWQFVPAPGYTGDIQIGFLQGAQTWWGATVDLAPAQRRPRRAVLRERYAGATPRWTATWASRTSCRRPTAGGTQFQIRVLDASDTLINNGRVYTFSLPPPAGRSARRRTRRSTTPPAAAVAPRPRPRRRPPPAPPVAARRPSRSRAAGPVVSRPASRSPTPARRRSAAGPSPARSRHADRGQLVEHGPHPVRRTGDGHERRLQRRDTGRRQHQLGMTVNGATRPWPT